MKDEEKSSGLFNSAAENTARGYTMFNRATQKLMLHYALSEFKYKYPRL